MGGLFDLPGLSGFIVMRLAQHNIFIHCVQLTMKKIAIIYCREVLNYVRIICN